MCQDTLARGGERTLRCPHGHSFDIAKQGYATLVRGRVPHAGDSAEMIEARDDFLRAGHYRFIADAVIADVPPTSGLIVDAGAGPGWYLGRLLDRRPDALGLAVDVSKPALRRAARAHPRVAAVLADLWQPLPIADGSAEVIVNVFAPRNGAEFHRVLRPGGVLVVVTPAADHLREPITEHGLLTVDADKKERLTRTLGAHFTADHTASHRRRLDLTGDQMRTLIAMTPSARHVRLDELAPGAVTAAVDVTAFTRRDRPLPTPAADHGTDR
ncbi:methyltransferase domain-containing protein [Actinoplanes sp. NPDC051633]|uniref:methyltransferase domain-containing protein n=1 Tax=Actinoplanes sp. NPDC051633 TaxID=3155670 RepID=UPI003438DDAE